jgi:hypothetical protein
MNSPAARSATMRNFKESSENENSKTDMYNRFAGQKKRGLLAHGLSAFLSVLCDLGDKQLLPLLGRPQTLVPS